MKPRPRGPEQAALFQISRRSPLEACILSDRVDAMATGPRTEDNGFVSWTSCLEEEQELLLDGPVRPRCCEGFAVNRDG
jgi:hypothetical protein